MLNDLNKETGPQKCPSPVPFLIAYKKQIERDEAFVDR
jgi:hypothetical protein